MFAVAMPKFKGGQKIIVTAPILNRFLTFLHHVVQNRKICNICAGRQSVAAENFEI
jgi:hypothetical protein